MKIAILDDYQGAALAYADWSRLQAQGQVEVFNRNLQGDAAVQALQDYDVICTMRERMPMPASLLERLPKLKLIVITGPRNRSLDVEAASRLGIVVSHSLNGPDSLYATSELAWGLLLSATRSLSAEDRGMRSGGWQTTIGTVLHGRTLGLLGLGRLGGQVAHYANAFGMSVIAWSQNLTDERAAEAGARRVDKDELFRQSDAISIHLVLSERTRGLVAAADLALMKPGAILVNTSRGPIVDQPALLAALRERRIVAALDVFDEEPLPPDHPLRATDNTVLSPHLGYVTTDTYKVFYPTTVECVEAFIAGAPVRLLNPEALPGRSA